MKIKCPQCDFENEEGSKFCKNCNEPLVKFKIPSAIENPYIKLKEEYQPFEHISDEEAKVKNKIEKERKMRTCGNCGISLSEGITKCPECGKMVCKNCGNILGTGVTKCPRCGEPTVLGAFQTVGCFMTLIGLFILILVFLIVFRT